MGDLALGLDRKLHIIAIGPLDQADPFDVADGERLDTALLADQCASSDAHAEGVV
jgi:hypothetical protein